ncbi:MAG: S8 family serine peptidase [Xanthomonadales bacterium]|nr:S8 family serine peptidase [Xanthomonadales bacterium]MBP6078928.1 S8 family serine peptidase [Xanthomonadales bacterium]MBP7624894.1 S8 family serine peptidase [Xanthomonadales bacterium]
MTFRHILLIAGVIVGTAVSAAAPHPVSLTSLQIDTRDAVVPDAAVTPDAALLVQFPGPVTAAQRKALAAVATIYAYLPQDAFLVRMPVASRDQRLAAAGVRWSSAWQPAYKIGRGVRDAAKAVADGRKRQLMLQLFPDRDPDAVVAELRAMQIPGIGAAARGAYFSRLRLEWSADEIAAHADRVAALAEVFWLDLEPRRSLLNDTTVWVGQSGLAGGQATTVFANGIHGEGQVVAVLDTGIDPDMCYFRTTGLGLPPTNACNGGTTIDPAQRKILGVNFLWSNDCNGGIASNEWDSHDHGTHVAGTIAGDNFATPIGHDAGDGMAPAAKLVIQDGGLTTDNCADLPGIGCPVVDLNPIFQQTYDQGARIHSNSWGDNENDPTQNDYSAGSQDVDEFMWNHPDFLIFFAAGNSGPGTASVGSPSTAKSAVSVGATLRSTSSTGMASFSSCGPTDDGRRKPEITVPGSSIVSADNDLNVGSNNCSTRSMSGTSMATPGAAGLTALIRQYYVDGYYPSGNAVVANAMTPSAALMRATLVNSGQNMSGATVMPSNCQGWGRVTLDEALYFPGDARTLWVDDDTTGLAEAAGERRFEFVVSAGQPLKMTLAWTDYPSTPAALPHLVNDLDLIVEQAGTTYLGNVWSGGQSVAGGSADRLNTLEQVLISAPVSGPLTVTVRAHNIPSGPQPFALVVTGAVTPDPSNVFVDGFE